MYSRLAKDLKQIKGELIGIQSRMKTMYEMESIHLKKLESAEEDSLDLEFQLTDLESALTDMESILEGVGSILDNQEE